ncbi:MAG: c-type cytochrome [Thermomicrobium sp.]|nr:cytochrome c [Thermomicrobium sp.]MDW8058768.1 c-type cytochrome [Thermomicrobium sp.]
MNRTWLVVALLTIGIGAIGLVVTAALAQSRPVATTASTVERGRWIYFTATNPDTGAPIPYSGGMMMPMACADCHGADGRGLRTPMFVSPDIRYRNLTDPAGMREPDGTRGHAYRSDEEIRRAITEGIGPDGEPLAWPMPRWHLTDRELEDLLAFLKALP